MEKDCTKITKWKIEYSEKVFIDLKTIYESTDDENREILWKHFLTLLAVLNPTSRAKEIIAAQKESKIKEGKLANEEDFLTNIIQKVSGSINVTESDDPAKMMTGLMSSGIFTELVDDMNNGISNGDLDIGKMMSSLQGVMGNLSNVIQDMNKK